MIKNIYWSSRKVPVLMKLEFSPLIFEKCSYIKFLENPSSEIRVVPYGKTDGQTVFHNFAKSASKLNDRWLFGFGRIKTRRH